METIKWYQSKTIISQLIAVIFFGLAMTWVVTVDEATQQELVNMILTFGTLFAQLYSIYGRIVAKSKIK